MSTLDPGGAHVDGADILIAELKDRLNAAQGENRRLRLDYEARGNVIESLKREVTEVSLVARRAMDENDKLKAELAATKNNRLISAVFGHHKGAPRPFAIYRRIDRAVVALGAEFPDGAAALRLMPNGGWTTTSEGGADYFRHDENETVWLSDELESLAEAEQENDRLRTAHDRLLPVVEAVGKWAAWHKGVAPDGTMFIPEDELHLAYAALGSHWREATPGDTPGQILPGEDDPRLIPAVDALGTDAADGAGTGEQVRWRDEWRVSTLGHRHLRTPSERHSWGDHATFEGARETFALCVGEGNWREPWIEHRRTAETEWRRIEAPSGRPFVGCQLPVGDGLWCSQKIGHAGDCTGVPESEIPRSADEPAASPAGSSTADEGDGRG